MRKPYLPQEWSERDFDKLPQKRGTIRHWTRDEVEQLADEIAKGMSWEQIAAAHIGRTPSSCYQQAKLIGFSKDSRKKTAVCNKPRRSSKGGDKFPKSDRCTT